jgi:pimeloyl-ACP methyl ester carboxylesterase
MQDWARHLQAELSSVAIERAIVVGHSMGGMLALEYCRQFPAMVIGLGLVGTTDVAWDPERRAGFVANAKATSAGLSLEDARTRAGRLVGSRFLDDHPEWLDVWYQRLCGYAMGDLAGVGFAVSNRDDLTDFTPTLRVPVAVIHGVDDQAVPYESGKGLAARIPGATLTSIEGCGHAAPLERPEEVTAALKELLGQTGVVT